MGYAAISRDRLLAYLKQLAQTHKELIVLQRAINDVDYQIQGLAIPRKIEKRTDPDKDSLVMRIILYIMVLCMWVGLIGIGILIALSIFYLIFRNVRLPILTDRPILRFFVTALIITLTIAIPVHIKSWKDDKVVQRKRWEEYCEEVKSDQLRVSIENRMKEQIIKQRNALKLEYNKTINILTQLYEVRVNGEYLLYPKYRDIVPIVMFMEYLDSRRCSTLIGHEGAYNIYENEIRLNLIVTKLNDVINRLDDIKDNQYYLYNLISEANRKNNQIHQELLNGMAQISQNTALAAAYNEATANNTSAMRMIEEYRFLTRR